MPIQTWLSLEDKGFAFVSGQRRPFRSHGVAVCAQSLAQIVPVTGRLGGEVRRDFFRFLGIDADMFEAILEVPQNARDELHDAKSAIFPLTVLLRGNLRQWPRHDCGCDAQNLAVDGTGRC